MATLQTTVELIFHGIDQASETTDKVAQGLSDLNQAAGDIAAPFADFADRLIQVEAAALTTGAALVGVAINAADAFETGFREISTLIDEPIEGLQDFRKEILTYAATSTQSLDQVTAATYNAISQGVAYSDSLKAVSVAEKLAVAGKADLNATLQSLLGTLNAYGKGIDSASEFSDVFFTTVKLGKTTIPELAASLSGVTSTATLGGVSIQELGAAIATVTAAGAGTSQAVTRINAALTAIIKPSGEAAKLAESLGLAFDANALKSKGLAGVLADVATKTGGSAEQMAILFGSTEALNAVNVLAITNSEKFKLNLDAMSKAAGATDAAFAKMSDATDTLAQALQVALVSFGTPLLDAFNSVEDALASLAVAFIKTATDGAQGFKPLQQFIADNMEGIAKTIETVAGNLPAAFEQVDWSGLIDSLGGLGQEVRNLLQSFFGEIDITTVEGLTSAIQTVMNSFETLTRIVTGIVSEFRPFADAIGETIRHFNDLDDASKLEFGQTLGWMKLLVDAGTGLGLALIAIGRAGLEMGTVLDAVFGGVKVAVNSIQVTLNAMVLGFLNIRASALSAAISFNEFANGGETFKSSQWKQELANLTIVLDSVAANLDRNKNELEQGWNLATGDAAEKTEAMRRSLDNSEAALRNIGKAGQETAPEINKVGTAIEELGKIKIEPLEAFEALPKSAKKAADAMSNVGNASRELVEKLITVKDENGKIVRTYTDLVPVMEKTGGTFSVVGKGAGDAADKTQDAKDQLDALTQSGKLSVDQLLELTKTTNDFKAKMEEIASNERIKTIEATISLKTAGLEADMERVKAAFASIDNTVTNTGDLLGSLFGNLADAGTYDKLDIQEQIDLENKRRQEALDMQKKLAEAEIERIEAQTAALNRGDALIQIDGTGLEPELEAFMWKILGAIRVRANAEFSDYLLGIGATA